MIGSQIFADPECPRSLRQGCRWSSSSWLATGPIATMRPAPSRRNSAKRMPSAACRPRRSPHHTDAQAYDIVYLLKQVMEKANITGDPAKLAAERTAIRDGLKGGAVHWRHRRQQLLQRGPRCAPAGLRHRDQGHAMDAVRSAPRGSVLSGSGDIVMRVAVLGGCGGIGRSLVTALLAQGRRRRGPRPAGIDRPAPAASGRPDAGGRRQRCGLGRRRIRRDPLRLGSAGRFRQPGRLHDRNPAAARRADGRFRPGRRGQRPLDLPRLPGGAAAA